MAAQIESIEEFDRDDSGQLTPKGQAQRWTVEFQAARKKLKAWHERGDKVLDRYLDEREQAQAGASRLNLFTANVETQQALLYGQVPKVSVGRRHGDSEDDIARVAGEMLERCLNTDIERDGDSYASAIAYCLEDRLLPGFGFAAARYEVQMGQVPEVPAQVDPVSGLEMAPAVPAHEAKQWENVETEHYFWKSVLYSPCRTFEDSRWWAWCVPITRDQAKQRFGEDVAKQLPASTANDASPSDAQKSDPWTRVDVWEIWCKDERAVHWFCEGYDRVLDTKPDPLGLDDFWPFPKPMMARPTTRSFVPVPDFVIAQDLYNEIDTLTARISILESALQVTGFYDSTSEEMATLFSAAVVTENRMIPVKNWAMREGNTATAVEWFPIEQVGKTLLGLSQARDSKIGLLQQVTGWSDIMRGQSNPTETLGAQQMKSRYGSVRLQRSQMEFAEFATGLQRVKAEIIAQHYDVQTIIDRSNVMLTPDKDMAQQAAEFLKSHLAHYRIEVKPEAVALNDYATMKQERVEVIGALSQLFAAAQPVLAAVGPGAAPLFLELAKWTIAGTKGSAQMEGVFDRFVKQAEQQAAAPKPPPQPDPKAQADIAKAKASVQTAQIGVQKAQIDLQGSAAEHVARMRELQMETVREAQEARSQTVPGRVVYLEPKR